MIDNTFLQQLIEKANADGIQKLVVGAVILKNGKVLVLQRAQEEFMAGLVEAPSGGVEQSESLDAALNREVLEETGLLVTKIIDYLGSFDYTSGSGKKARQFNFLVETAEGEVLLNPQEHSMYYLLSHEEVIGTKFNISLETRSVLLRSFVAQN